jgi:uncharacterized protein (TIRG00374 family)
MSKNLIKNIKVSLYVFLILIGFLYIKRNFSTFYQAIYNNPLLFIIMSIINIIIFIVNTIFLIITTKLFNRKIEFLEGFFLTVRSSLLNFILPIKAGLGFRAVSLKRAYNLNFKSFSLITLANYLLVFISSTIISIILYPFLANTFNFSFLLFLLVFLFFLLLILFLPMSIKKWITKYIRNKTFRNLLFSWQVFKTNLYTLGKLFIIFLVNLILGSSRFFLQFKALGIEVNIFKVLYMQSISTIAQIISIIPGGLGTTELVLALTGQSLNLNKINTINSQVLGRVVFIFNLLIAELLIFLIKKFYGQKHA